MIPAFLLAATLATWPAIHDGDSLRLGGERLRLGELDAPELKQSCLDAAGQAYAAGIAARDYLIALVAGRRVRCDPHGHDLYGRTIATCTAEGDTESLNEQMVRAGWAFAAYGAGYWTDQLEAKAAHRGVWQGRCELPKEWRREHHIGFAGRRR